MTTEDYINQQQGFVNSILNKLREIILSASDEISEGFSYGMPAYKAYGFPLLYFAVYKHHIGVYATPTAHKAFSKELKKYKQGKGSIQFPINAPCLIHL
jgi:uncharacterized protein YdhG (YjbR/CyaY superfamily)